MVTINFIKPFWIGSQLFSVSLIYLSWYTFWIKAPYENTHHNQ